MEDGIKLFLDDVRDPPVGTVWHVCRTAVEAITIVRTGRVTHISFDYDLGEGPSGYDAARVIGKLVATGTIAMPEWTVHSANADGRAGIEASMKSVMRSELGARLGEKADDLIVLPDNIRSMSFMAYGEAWPPQEFVLLLVDAENIRCLRYSMELWSFVLYTVYVCDWLLEEMKRCPAERSAPRSLRAKARAVDVSIRNFIDSGLESGRMTLIETNVPRDADAILDLGIDPMEVAIRSMVKQFGEQTKDDRTGLLFLEDKYLKRTRNLSREDPNAGVTGYEQQ
jgi:hypothetical protein